MGEAIGSLRTGHGAPRMVAPTTPVRRRGAARSRQRRWRGTLRTAAASMVAVAAMVVGALWCVGVSALHDQVLDRDTYLDALDETGAYRRLYSEVLTDEAVRDLTTRLFEGLSDAGVAPQDAAAVTNAALRLALPPAILREATDVLVTDVVAYLRGNRTALDAPVPVLDALQRIDPAAAAFVRQAITAASSLLLEHLQEVESFLHALADGVVEGQIPSMVPFVGGRLVAEEELLTVLDGLTATLVPADVRDQVLAAVESSDRRDALVARALEALRSSLQELSERLAAGRDIDVDLIETVLVLSGADRGAVVDRAEAVRAVVTWVPSRSRYAGVATLVAGGIVLVTFHRRRPARATAAVGGGLLAAGAAVWWGSAVVGSRVGSPLTDAASGDGTRAVPGAAARLLGDVDGAVLTTLATPIHRAVLTLGLLGVGTILTGAACRLWEAMATTDRRRAVGAVTASALATVAMTISVQPAPARAARACNGHAELCDRRYDEVVQAATHNSMSSPDVVRVWPEHDGNIREQLDFGIRMLMIDASYWNGVGGTELQQLRSLATTPATAAVIDAIAARLAPRPGTYLCHSQCALGAIPMTTALLDIRAFLDDNPDEVVTLMIQDGVTPADVEAAFRESGLADLVYEETPGGAWPTLGEMIERDQRVVVFSEQHVSPPGWYLSAFQHIRDTPYGARTAEELSCAPNRGPRDAPLFVLNHWIERRAPDRAAAAIINAKDFIVERAQRCASERGQMPNFVAVSFYGIGDVLGAVDELNGLGAP